MNLKRNILTIMTILAFVSANAKIATWSISPNYQELKRYYGDMCLFQNNGKWGIISSGDNVFLQANYDFITPFVNGYALIGTKEGSKLLLECILGEDGHINFLNDKFYLPNNYQYVSEEKIVVSNKNGKFGYINTSGDIVVKCQFDNALPFKEGYAPVKQGKYMKFITENYDRNTSRNTLIVDFHYGEMTVAGCFSNGKAPIAYNKDYALISTNGQKVRKLNETEFKQIYKSNNSASNNTNVGFNSGNEYVEYQENGRLGLKTSNEIIVTPQFDHFEDKFFDGFILASIQGKKGLLKIIDGNVSIQTKVGGKQATTLEVDRKGNIPSITIEYSFPESLNDLSFLIDEGNGQLVDRTSSLTHSGNNSSISFSPMVAKDAEVCDIKTVIESRGLVVATYNKQFSVSYPIKLRVSSPGPSTVRANELDIATVSSTIYNDSNKAVTVTVNWSNGKSCSVSIPAHSSRSVSTSFSVTSSTSKIVSIQLSTGERASSTINFETFF